ncbi:MAG: hypothetical protein CMA77_00730 [Euryarchaeota archaeon]|nr:hypothetical protein [Euryarchaeota archaeon]
MVCPLTTPIERVEAHYDEPNDPPIRVQVFINKLYSTEDYDDSVPYFGWLFGGSSEILLVSEVKHENHGNSIVIADISWNMDGEGWMDISPEEVVVDGRTVYELDMGHKEIYNHIECTENETVNLSYNITEQDGEVARRVVEALIGFGETVGGLVLIGGGTVGTIASGGAAGPITVKGVVGGGSLVYDGIKRMIQAGVSEDYKDELIGSNPGQNLSVGTNYVWPLTLNEQAGVGGEWESSGMGMEIELVITPFEVVGPGWKSDAEGGSSCIQSSPIAPSQEIATINYDEIRTTVHNAFDSIRTAYIGINESTSLPDNWTDPYDNDNCDQINGTGDCDDWNNTQQQSSDPFNNTDPYNSTTHTVSRGLIMTEGNGIVENITRGYLDSAMAVNPDVIYPFTMDLWYANFLTQGGQYFDALSYYESAIIGSINAIETAPPPPPAMVTVQAEGDDIPEDLFIEIYSGDCGDDCAEEDLVFVGGEGDSEIETALESGEYTVVMISDGDVYSSEYMEVQSGGDLTILKVSDGGEIDSNVLNLSFYLQGLIVAALPGLIGFAGSRQYLEGKTGAQESKKLEPSTTPLWIGVVIFLAIFFMMVG